MLFFFKNRGEDKNDEIQSYIKEKLYYLEKTKELEELSNSMDIYFYSYLDNSIKQIKQERKKIDEIIKKGQS